MGDTIRFRGTSVQARMLVRQLAGSLSGRVPDTYSISGPILARAGIGLLSKIQQSFITLSRTGSDPVTGISWPPLSPKTIAGRRTTAGERKQLGIGKGTRPTLTPEQDKRWRGIFAFRLAILRAQGMGEQAAMGLAAAAAWSILKASGAKTKIELLGSRSVDSLRDTGELLRSLTPGFEDSPALPDGQILDVSPGRVTVGTNKKPWHHTGVPGRLPQRKLWPTDGRLPDSWNAAVSGAISRGLAKAVASILGR